jgi:TolB protein
MWSKSPLRRNLLFIFVALLVAVGLYLSFVARQETTKGHIAFVANLNGNWDLFIMDGDGTHPVQLTQTTVDERSPTISPDGKQIVFATSDGKVWVMNLSSKDVKELPLPTSRNGYPTWLQDGSGVIYTAYSFTPPTEDADLYVHSFKDQQQKLLLLQTGPQDYPALSPSGDTLAYVSSLATTLPGFGSAVTQQLWLASLKDGKSNQLLFGSAHNTRPNWSSDGKEIVFSSDRNGNVDLWIVRLGSQEIVQLTSTPAAETSPAWSPDGQEITYVSSEGNQSQLMIINLKTHESRRLSPFGNKMVELKDPHWK